MFEREGKREKILEVRNRELRLKLKTKASSHLMVGEDKGKEAEEVFADKAVLAAEAEFFEVIRKQQQKAVPEEMEEELLDIPPIEPEPVVVEEPPPPPPPEPEPEPKKGKKKGKKKK